MCGVKQANKLGEKGLRVYIYLQVEVGLLNIAISLFQLFCTSPLHTLFLLLHEFNLIYFILTKFIMSVNKLPTPSNLFHCFSFLLSADELKTSKMKPC